MKLSSRLLLLLLVLVLYAFCSVECFNAKDGCDKYKVDNYTSILVVVGNPKVKFSETKQQFDHYCRERPKYIKYMKDFRKCFHFHFPSHRITMNLVIYFINDLGKLICDRRSLEIGTSNRYSYYRRNDKNRFYKMMHCYNNAKEKLDKCAQSLVNNYTQISHFKGNYKILQPLYCCSFWVFMDCNINAIREHALNDTECTEAYVRETWSFNRSQFEVIQNYICDQFTHRSTICDNIILNANFNQTLSPNLPKTIAIPLIDMLQSLNDIEVLH